jgi:hypothetical protein
LIKFLCTGPRVRHRFVPRFALALSVVRDGERNPYTWFASASMALSSTVPT